MKDYMKTRRESRANCPFPLSAPWHNLFARKELNIDIKETLIMKYLTHFKDEVKYILIEKIYY